jgi:hypothetical protein
MPAMGREDRDTAATDLLFWDSDEEANSELHLEVDWEPLCDSEFTGSASPNTGTSILSIWPPGFDCSRLGWCLMFAASVCERAEWTVVDKVSTVLCTEAAS